MSVVITHPKKGVFLGDAFWSMINCGSRTQAMAFRTADAARAFLAQTKDRGAACSFVDIAGTKKQATVDDLKAAGLGDLLGGMKENVELKNISEMSAARLMLLRSFELVDTYVLGLHLARTLVDLRKLDETKRAYAADQLEDLTTHIDPTLARRMRFTGEETGEQRMEMQLACLLASGIEIVDIDTILFEAQENDAPGFSMQ